MIEHITFGIIIDDIVFPEGRTQMGVLGGGGPQTAWGMAAALGSGETVGLVAGVGADLEDRALSPMRRAEIDLRGVRVTGLPTPRAWQTIEPDGRRIQTWRVPPETLGPQLARSLDVLPPEYRAAHAFHWGIHPSEDEWVGFARQLREQGRLISLEPFRAPDAPLDDDKLRAILAACDIFSPNWHEATRIAGAEEPRAVLERFRALGGQVLAIRRGADGADVWNLPEGRGVHVPAIETAVTDVVGAGNAFCGALVARLRDGIDEAACHASVVASYLIEQIGLPPSLPNPADYARRLDEARAGRTALKLSDL
ncbi:MAG: PfkB family carbohydrate kinase [Anaerolineae bacterium]|nr:PfkB family carbohydrate kinase [Anaerolineae bacterium]